MVGLARPPTTFGADPNQIVGDRAHPHSRARSRGHDTRRKVGLDNIHPINLTVQVIGLAHGGGTLYCFALVRRE